MLTLADCLRNPLCRAALCGAVGAPDLREALDRVVDGHIITTAAADAMVASGLTAKQLLRASRRVVPPPAWYLRPIHVRAVRAAQGANDAR